MKGATSVSQCTSHHLSRGAHLLLFAKRNDTGGNCSLLKRGTIVAICPSCVNAGSEAAKGRGTDDDHLTLFFYGDGV